MEPQLIVARTDDEIPTPFDEEEIEEEEEEEEDEVVRARTRARDQFLDIHIHTEVNRLRDHINLRLEENLHAYQNTMLCTICLVIFISVMVSGLFLHWSSAQGHQRETLKEFMLTVLLLPVRVAMTPFDVLQAYVFLVNPVPGFSNEHNFNIPNIIEEYIVKLVDVSMYFPPKKRACKCKK